MITKVQKAEEKKWQEEADAQSLAETYAILDDKKRLTGAKKGAVRLLENEKKREEETEDRIAGLKKLLVRELSYPSLDKEE